MIRAGRGGVVYGTGALLAAERRTHRMLVLHRQLLDEGIEPVVPSVVLAQAWRGGPQAQLSRLLQGCVIEALAENAAREVGRLLAAHTSSDVVDAAVVVSAMSRGDLVVTSDPNDISSLAAAAGVTLAVQAI